MGYGNYGGWAPYVSVAKRRQKAERHVETLKRKGQIYAPVTIQGRLIARSFWGKAWCDNLEAYSDLANRLPRGRTYVRNGSVIDLRIDTGKVNALVMGSEIYRVEINVQPLEPTLWQGIVSKCTGQVASLIEVLQGRLSSAVMAVVTRQGEGLFPQTRQLKFSCSCPDSATMCKHVAATLYGVGARLDDAPELLFRLRHVEPQDLIQQISTGSAVSAPGAQDTLGGVDLSALFGIDLDEPPAAVTGRQPPSPRAGTPTAVPVTPAPGSVKATGTRKKSGKTAAVALTASELMARGVPRHMIQWWLKSGVLVPTAQRGTYQTTPGTEARIERYVAQK
ncbi:MAG: hypothetical protein H7346_11935 [Burkholderiaceae bacterium]|nr:hypothetical protein [Burkholderiaceae bacterium]